MLTKHGLLKFMNYLSSSLLPMLFWILMTFGFDKPYIAVLTFCAAMLHELGHILASVLTKVGTGGINGKLNGLSPYR